MCLSVCERERERRDSFCVFVFVCFFMCARSGCVLCVCMSI
jgi:hypothetical protein